MYYVVYVDVNGREHSIECSTREEAIRYYRTNLRNMAYGYISDDEALVTAEAVKQDYEEELQRREAEMLDNLRGRWYN